VRLFEESGIIERHDFRDGRSRYEETPDHHHDHLIDMKTGKVVEFVDEEIEALQNAIAKKLGYKLVGPPAGALRQAHRRGRARLSSPEGLIFKRHATARTSQRSRPGVGPVAAIFSPTLP
jgi:hypothetical protein